MQLFRTPLNLSHKDIVDIGAVATAFGTAFDWLPQIGALFAIIWTMIRIYEWARVRIFGYAPTKGIGL